MTSFYAEQAALLLGLTRNLFHIDDLIPLLIKIRESSDLGTDHLLPCTDIAPDNDHLCADLRVLRVNGAQRDHLTIETAVRTAGRDTDQFAVLAQDLVIMVLIVTMVTLFLKIFPHFLFSFAPPFGWFCLNRAGSRV